MSVGRLPYEIVVIDGGSTDGSREWLVAQKDVVFLGERELAGSVKAFNHGFYTAQGKYIANLNDDLVLRDNALEVACEVLDERLDVGQVAIPYTEFEICRPEVHSIVIEDMPYLYANFGVARKWLGDFVGWWGDYLFHYGGDCEISMRIWEVGYKVIPLDGHSIFHLSHKDALRRKNQDAGAFFTRWRGTNRLPPDNDWLLKRRRIDAFGYDPVVEKI